MLWPFWKEIKIGHNKTVLFLCNTVLLNKNINDKVIDKKSRIVYIQVKLKRKEENMIVDKSGNIFDDRRKSNDRRKKDVKVGEEKRKGNRREDTRK